MPRPTIFGKMGFRPDPRGAYENLMKSKTPFYNRVQHSHDSEKKRYAKFNFPLNQGDPIEMKDEENPNLLDSVRQMCYSTQNQFSTFVKTSRLNVPTIP